MNSRDNVIVNKYPDMNPKTSAFMNKYPFLREILRVEENYCIDLCGYIDKMSPAETHEYMLQRGWRVPEEDKERLTRILNGKEKVHTSIMYCREWVRIPDELSEDELGIAELLYVPGQRLHHSVREDLEEWTKYHFVLKNGTVIKNAVAADVENTTPGYEEMATGETVLEAIERLGIDPDEIKAIVAESYYKHWRMNVPYDDEYEQDYKVFVYTLPEKVKLSGLIDDLKKEYADRLNRVKDVLAMRETTLPNGTKVVLEPILSEGKNLDELPKYTLPLHINYEINLSRDHKQVDSPYEADYRIRIEYRPYGPQDEQWFFMVEKKAEDGRITWDNWCSARQWFSAGSLDEGLKKSLNALEIAEEAVPGRDLRGVCEEVFGEAVKTGNSAKL